MKNIKALILVFLAFIMVACGGAEERKAAYMEKAENSLNAGDLDKARIELKNVLQIDPKDAQAYFKLGNIFEQKKEFRKAFGNYNKAVELDQNNTEYLSKIGLFYTILAGDIEKGREQLALIHNIDMEDIYGLKLEAAILLKEKKYEESKKITQTVFDRKPDDVENVVFLASLHSREQEYTKSIDILNKAITISPNATELQSLLAQTLFLNKDYAKAEGILKGILEKNPEIFKHHQNLALFYHKAEDADKAENVLRSAIAAEQEDATRKLTLVDYIQQVKGNQEAITELYNMIEKNPDIGDLRLQLGRLYAADNQLDDAIKVFKTAADDFSNEETGIKSRVALAVIYVRQGDVDAASRVIDDAVEIAPNDSEVNMIKAKIALHNKNYEQAIISLRTVTKDDPENIEAYLLLSAAHKQNDEVQQAEDVLAQAYENNRTNVESLKSLAQYYIQNKKISDAEKIIDSLLLINETNEYALTVKAKLLNARKDYVSSEKLARDLIKHYPENPEGYIQSIAPMLENGKVQELKALLEEGYDKTGRSIQLLQTIVAIDSGQKNYDAAISRLQSEISQDDKNAELHRMLAKVYDASGDKEKSSEEFNNAIFIDPELGDTYIELANLYTRTGEDDRAVKILNDGKNRIPANTKIIFSLAQIYESTGDYDKAIGEYEAILATSNDNLLANNNLAALLSDHKSDDASLKRAKDIADKLKAVKQPVIQDTVGWVYYRTGDYSDAVEVLKQVVAAQPEVQVFNYHLGMAYFKSGNNTEAKKHLEAALASDKDFQGRDDAETTLKSL